MDVFVLYYNANVDVRHVQFCSAKLKIIYYVIFWSKARIGINVAMVSTLQLILIGVFNYREKESNF